jgi:large conductance mechanosensitive channel
MFDEFKEFAMKGNVMDMAVGVIMGASFGKIVGTFTDGIIMPPIGKLLGGMDFSNVLVNLGDKPVKTLAEAKAAGVPVMTTGVLMTNIIDFLIVATVLFLLVKAVNKLKKDVPAPPPPAPTKDQALLSEIRDLLATRKSVGA